MSNERPSKCIDDSRTIQTHLIMPMHLNGYGRLFGGQLALWIDETAGIVARRHAGCRVTTAAIDNLRFRAAVLPNTVVILKGKVTHVGSSSIEVRVDSWLEDVDGSCKLINTAFVISVAIDEDGKPLQVPDLILQTEQEKMEFEAGKKRRDLRKKLNSELYD